MEYCAVHVRRSPVWRKGGQMTSANGCLVFCSFRLLTFAKVLINTFPKVNSLKRQTTGIAPRVVNFSSELRLGEVP